MVDRLEELRTLSGLVDGDAACECCAWAVAEIERLRDELFSWEVGEQSL